MIDMFDNRQFLSHAKVVIAATINSNNYYHPTRVDSNHFLSC